MAGLAHPRNKVVASTNVLAIGHVPEARFHKPLRRCVTGQALVAGSEIMIQTGLADDSLSEEDLGFVDRLYVDPARRRRTGIIQPEIDRLFGWIRIVH